MYLKYKSQEICDNAVDACLLLLKFIPELFLRNKMLVDLDYAVFFNYEIVLIKADSDNVTF